jgi:hypothetical protein
MNKTTTEVVTRPAAGAEGVTTNLTINWEGMTEDDLRALAQQAMIVKLQGNWRKNGIPAGDHEVNAVDYKVGVRAPRQPKDLAAMIQALSPEEKAALLAKLSA